MHALTVEVASGAVMVLGGAMVSVPGEDLGVAQRQPGLVLARHAVALGLTVGDREMQAWGRLWSMDVHAANGRRVELLGELAALTVLADSWVRPGSRGCSWCGPHRRSLCVALKSARPPRGGGR